MAASAASERLDRLERFLDNIDKVRSPSDLQEPFASLWLRAHGEKPTMMSSERKDAFLSGGMRDGMFGDVQIAAGSSTGDAKGSIEFVSPRDVGPTVEMEVEEEKVTFKMAGDRDLKNMEAKEEAANEMISLQGSVKSISGLGGEVAKVWEGIRDVAKDYRDGNYIKALELGGSLKKVLDTEKFRKSVLLELQKKISEYKDLGADTTKASEKFKDLAKALKDDSKDFIEIAGEINSLAEDSIKGIVDEEVVAEVKTVPMKKEPKKEEAPAPKRILKKKKIPRLPEEAGEPAPEKEKSEEEEKAPEPEEKPVIKIVTVKKLVPVQKVMKERMEQRQQREKEEAADDGDIMELDDEESPEPVAEPEPSPEPVIEEQKPVQEDIVDEEPAPQPKEEAPSAPEGPSKEEVQAAFKKYQFVYNASIKMHEAGKDVSQIFDLMTFAEDSRKKGDLKTYIGVCNQMENMLIGLQK